MGDCVPRYRWSASKSGAIPRFARRDGSELGIPDLSASEEQAALFAFAFTWLRLSRSVVLVDTPELHIHPKVHADFFGRLSRLGPDNQLLAATSSEALLRSVPVSQVIDLSSSTSRKR
jgi:predicted ATPase